jgi:predicted PhzF superfamily epimerase YddE/YHI9
MDLLVLVESESVVRCIRPKWRTLRTIEARGVIVTARSASTEFDFVSRFFSISAGLGEDPVTGSAHCCLGPFWSPRLGRTALIGRQVSARGGVVRTSLAGNRVLLGGRAVTILRGEVLPPPTG